jgi:cobalt/nickel transport system permease protein
VHIPDGYLSPQTCAVGFAVTAPFWFAAGRRVQRTVRSRNVPTLAVLSAVCFLIMMFNIPIPDGTTAHAVGGGLVAVLLGPWAAVIAISVALGFQALLFGDGGVLSYGVNCLNMAVILPFVALGTYRLLATRSELTSTRRAVAAAIGGYVGINVAALACGIELGIQPTLFHSASGAPLYSPYHLSQSIPAMLLAHLSVAGFAEAIVTGGVVAYLQRANLPLLRVNHPGIPAPGEETVARRVRPIVAAGIAVLVMVVLTPIGLLAPGGAFGEDSPATLNLHKYHLSAVPAGLNHWNGLWNHVLFNRYDFGSDRHRSLGYVVSAVVGIVVVGTAVFLIGMAIQYAARRQERSRTAAAQHASTKAPSQ